MQYYVFMQNVQFLSTDTYLHFLLDISYYYRILFECYNFFIRNIALKDFKYSVIIEPITSILKHVYNKFFA